MSKLTNFRRSGLDKEEAGQWIARIDRGLSRAEQEEFTEWMRHPRRRDVLLRLAEDWDSMGVVAELAELFPLREAGDRQWLLIGRAAAVLLVVVALAGMMFYWRPRGGSVPPMSATQSASRAATPAAAGFRTVYATAIGERRAVELPDHSRLQLNTNTEVQVQFSANARLLTMSRGEAMFEVAKDPARVFTVRVAGYEFKAVGTAFDIRADSPNGLQLTVTEGRVRVHQGKAQDDAPTVFEDTTDVVVEANKAVSIAQRSERIDALTAEQVAAAVAWQHGALIFKATPLAQVVNEFARYSTERFVIADPKLANTPVSGYFEVADIDALAAALEQNVHVTVTKHNGYLSLSRSDQHQ